MHPARTDKTHVIAAFNADRFRDWCRTHGINPRTVTYLSGPEHLYGLRDYHLVLLDDYERHWLFRADADADALARLSAGALDIHRQWDVPLVDKGRISGWQ